MATLARQKAQAKYNSKPEQVNRRENRNKARRIMIKAGKAHKGDGKDVAHLNNNTYDEKKKNLAMQTKAKNRSFPRDKKGHRR